MNTPNLVSFGKKNGLLLNLDIKETKFSKESHFTTSVNQTTW
jgi:hypothetical protein